MIETMIGSLTADEVGLLADYNCDLAAEYFALADDPEVSQDLRTTARKLAKWRRKRCLFLRAETAATEAYEAKETRSSAESSPKM